MKHHLKGVALLFLACLGCMTSIGCDVRPSDEPLTMVHPSQVTIYRDDFGVPHIHGETDAAAVFGFAYAQAEDNFEQLEENYIRAIGRASEVFGPESLLDDWLNRSLQVETLSVREYEGANEPLRALLDGFSDGLNHYLAIHPEIAPRLIERFEPWYPLALIRYLYYQSGFLHASGISWSQFLSAMRQSANDPEALAAFDPGVETGVANQPPRSEQGSNAMAVAPSRSTSGNALLFINPHLPFFGTSQVYEGHVVSDSGWNFSGYTRFGFPMPYVGFNEHLGWASTDNAADQADAYTEAFDDPADPLSYRYGTEHRAAQEWTEHIYVRRSTGLDTLAFRLRKTHHGPILAMSGGRPVSVRMAKFEEPGWLDQWYAMTRARDLVSFRQALSRQNMLFGNVVYADGDGSILYVYNAAVPRRSAGFNWRGIVDGANPDTDWTGYHALDEVPHVLNPASGWIQNCNSTPFLTTDAGNPDRSSFPEYMVGEGDNARSRAARRILSSHTSFSFDDWSNVAYDTFVMAAQENLPNLTREFEDVSRRNPERADRLQEAVGLLTAWDRISTVDSEAMTLFVLAGERSTGPGVSLGGLEQTLDVLEGEWGTWHVPWGSINRLQRARSNGEGLSDARPSIPIAGVPSWAGSMFTFWAQTPDGQQKRYGSGGNSYVAVIEFGEEIHAGSIHTFGASADPASSHHFDQASRYAEGMFKPAWLTLADVKQHASRSYHPGEEDSP